MPDDIRKYEMEINGALHKVKFFSRPHPLGGITWAFDYLVNGKSQGLVETWDKETVLADFYKLQEILQNECLTPQPQP